MPAQDYFIGLISGTSMDGIDCALVKFAAEQPVLVATLSHPYPAELRRRLFDLCQQPAISLALFGETHIAVGREFAAAVNAMLAREGLQAEQIAALGSHGQTIYHQPGAPLPFTLQIGDPNTIAFGTGITTVTDFRGKDMAAGGQGAPLAPLFHRQVFAADESSRVIVNLGGIANISILASGRPFLGYDTGPANVLLDYWVGKHRGAPFDANGDWAASGTVHEELLTLLLDDPYFAAPEPKSTGRETFNGDWLEARLTRLQTTLAAVDVQATLLELTATSVATEIENQLCADEVFLCGGGARNRKLLERIQALLPDSRVTTTDELGIAPDWVEAMTFAWLARQRLTGTPLDTPSITGASRAVILGAVYLPD